MSFLNNDDRLAVDEDWVTTTSTAYCSALSSLSACCARRHKHTGTKHLFCQRWPHDGDCSENCYERAPTTLEDVRERERDTAARACNITDYVVTICSGCGVSCLEVRRRKNEGDTFSSGSRNYPSCGCGGGEFENSKVVATRRMIVEWK